jgi:hypothetical protein
LLKNTNIYKTTSDDLLKVTILKLFCMKMSGADFRSQEKYVYILYIQRCTYICIFGQNKNFKTSKSTYITSKGSSLMLWAEGRDKNCHSFLTSTLD